MLQFQYMSVEKPNNKVTDPQIDLFDASGEPTTESLNTGNEESVAERFKNHTGVPLSSYYMLINSSEGRAELERILKMPPEDARACLVQIEQDEDKNLPRYWLK
jgi:hypothetical protein